MNILQVIPYFAFTRGGDVNVCYNLSKQLTNMGHEVTILTTTFDYNKEDTDSINNLTMVPIEYKFNFALFIYSPDMKKWLDENIQKYDIIHLHELRSYQNNIVLKYSKKYDVPYVLQPHASTPKHVNKQLFKEIYDVVYGNKIMQNAKCTIAVSEEEAYYDKQMKARDVELVYNGMNLEEYDKTASPVNEKYAIDSDYILYLGRIDPLKGINHIIESFAEVSSSYPDYKLVIAGKITDYKKDLDILIEKYDLTDKVIFTGFIDEEDKFDLYANAKVFVNPVKYMGGVSITVFEAILSDTPVIVTLESGELVQKINAGQIVEYGNTKELTNAMIKALEDESMNQNHLSNGQNYIKNNLKWENVTKRILDIYEKAINE